MLNQFVCIDLETTGLHTKLDKIIEIGGVKVVDGKVVEEFQTFVNPHRKLEERVTEITGITDDDLKDAPDMDEVFPKLMEFLGDLPLVGHRVLFDYSFIKKEAVNRNLTFDRMGIDTLKIARWYLSTLEHKTLSFLCQHYQIPHNPHRALEDARATVLLYEKMCEEFETEENPLYFKENPLIFTIKKDTPATIAQKERLIRLLEKHNLTLEMDIESLTKSEASRQTDKILSTYGR